MKIIHKFLLICLFFYLPLSGKAWGVTGHRVVGEIADSYLTKKTKREIGRILGFESVAMASNWPDFIRSNPAFKYLDPWHYHSVKGGLTENEVKAFLEADTSTGAFNKINFLIKELKQNRNVLSPETKTLYLRLLIHIVGDVHQPMHVGRPDDRGGNAIKVKWFSDDTNLHRVWDSDLIDFQKLSYTEYATAINHTTKEQRSLLQSQPVSQWFWDSYRQAEKLYADIKPDQRLDYLYNYKFIDLLNEKLLQGGVHLAGVLNDIFK